MKKLRHRVNVSLGKKKIFLMGVKYEKKIDLKKSIRSSFCLADLRTGFHM